MKNTKIVGTIGPASIDYKIFKALVREGLNVVRINLSHAKLEDMETILANVKRAREEFYVPLPIMIDTRGPELRVRTFKEGSVEIKKGQQFIFTERAVEGTEEIVSLNAPGITKCVSVGNQILAVNGLLTFDVIEIKDKDIITKAKNSGVISNRKSLSIPGVKFSTPYLNKPDMNDILWAIKNDVEYVAASFVNSKEDVETLRKFIKKNGGDLKIISKIESQLGVDNMDEIIEASDGIMVARGDLGVEVPMSMLPEIQKTMIKKCVLKGRPVITATEMLESMIENNRPTRAEVSDIANAIYDGTSCVMLSGETASGKYPVDAVRVMAEVCAQTEKNVKCYHLGDVDNNGDIPELISASAITATNSRDIDLIYCYTDTGATAGLISRFRPTVKIVGATPNEKTYRQLDLLWGVRPILVPKYNTTDEMFEIATKSAKDFGFVKNGNTMLITCGTPHTNGGTNLIKIIKIS